MLEADCDFVPMTHYTDAEQELLWFISAKDSFVYQQAAKAPVARRYTLSSEDAGIYAQIRGELSAVDDEDKLEGLWNLVASAYYPEGPRSPHVGLMCYQPLSSTVWLTTNSACVFLTQIAKAKLIGTRPDLGERLELDFS